MVEGPRGGWESPSYASRSTKLPLASPKDRPDVRRSLLKTAEGQLSVWRFSQDGQPGEKSEL